jgi:phosphoglycolate phosphatase
MRLTWKDHVFNDIEAILFDKDGTLCDSVDYYKNLALRRARLMDAKVPGVQGQLELAFGVERGKLKPQGLMAVGSRYENMIAAAAYLAEMGLDWSEAKAITENAFLEADEYLPFLQYAPLFSGVSDLLQALHRRGLKLAIVTADTQARAEAFVAAYKLPIDLVLGTEPGDLDKPDPQLYRRACEKWGLPPERTLLVGDNLVDLAFGRHAGAGGVVAVTTGLGRAEELTAADLVLERLDAEDVPALTG